MENKNKFQFISINKLKENEENLTDKEYALWDFMVTANIENMDYKNEKEDIICIRLNTVFFRSSLD